jgi:hypothetical protein
MQATGSFPLSRIINGPFDPEGKQAVRRNMKRFPHGFMFELTAEEYKSLRFHFGILEKGQHSKYLPYAFTEQGVAMLSSGLRASG